MCVCVCVFSMFVMEKSLMEGNYFIQTRVRGKAVFVCCSVFTCAIQINTNLPRFEIWHNICMKAEWEK